MASKKRVFHLIQSLANGGCENMLLRTIPLLDDFEHTVIVLKNPGDLAPRFRAADISIETIGYRGLFDFFGLRRLRNSIKEKRPDIIITYLFHADMIGRTALRGIDKTPIIPFLRTTYNHPRYWIARALERATRPLVQTYLANSEAVRQYYVEQLGVDPKKITVIPNSIDTHQFGLVKVDNNLMKSIGIDQSHFVIITVANLHINKGIRYLLEAFETIHKKYPDMRLLLVGDGPERKSLERQSAPYSGREKIYFLGHRSDVPALLRLSRIFILPTLFEGQSNSILEAMAAGVPVITTDIPENQMIVSHRKNGLLAPIRDASSLAKLIELLKVDQRLARALSDEAALTVQNQHAPLVVKTLWTNFLYSL